MHVPTGLRLEKVSTLPLSGAGAGPSSFPSLGESRNLHLLWEKSLQPFSRICLEKGGRNEHGAPNFRVVYGWQCTDSYYGDRRELFHLQKWKETLEAIPDWDRAERAIAEEFPGRYIPKPYPRHGDYHHIATCWNPGPNGEKRLWRPDRDWLVENISVNLERQARTPEEIRLEIAATHEYRAKRRREKAEAVGDSFGVRELAEQEAKFLIANPSLRQDPSLLLSPAVSYKRTKKRIRTNI